MSEDEKPPVDWGNLPQIEPPKFFEEMLMDIPSQTALKLKDQKEENILEVMARNHERQRERLRNRQMREFGSFVGDLEKSIDWDSLGTFLPPTRLESVLHPQQVKYLKSLKVPGQPGPLDRLPAEMRNVLVDLDQFKIREDMSPEETAKFESMSIVELEIEMGKLCAQLKKEMKDDEIEMRMFQGEERHPLQKHLMKLDPEKYRGTRPDPAAKAVASRQSETSMKPPAIKKVSFNTSSMPSVRDERKTTRPSGIEKSTSVEGNAFRKQQPMQNPYALPASDPRVPSKMQPPPRPGQPGIQQPESNTQKATSSNPTQPVGQQPANPSQPGYQLNSTALKSTDLTALQPYLAAIFNQPGATNNAAWPQQSHPPVAQPNQSNFHPHMPLQEAGPTRDSKPHGQEPTVSAYTLTNFQRGSSTPIQSNERRYSGGGGSGGVSHHEAEWLRQQHRQRRASESSPRKPSGFHAEPLHRSYSDRGYPHPPGKGPALNLESGPMDLDTDADLAKSRSGEPPSSPPSTGWTPRGAKKRRMSMGSPGSGRPRARSRSNSPGSPSRGPRRPSDAGDYRERDRRQSGEFNRRDSNNWDRRPSKGSDDRGFNTMDWQYSDDRRSHGGDERRYSTGAEDRGSFSRERRNSRDYGPDDGRDGGRWDNRDHGSHYYENRAQGRWSRWRSGDDRGRGGFRGRGGEYNAPNTYQPRGDDGVDASRGGDYHDRGGQYETRGDYRGRGRGRDYSDRGGYRARSSDFRGGRGGYYDRGVDDRGRGDHRGGRPWGWARRGGPHHDGQHHRGRFHDARRESFHSRGDAPPPGAPMGPSHGISSREDNNYRPQSSKAREPSPDDWFSNELAKEKGKP